jgi:hypothetical protein
MIVCLAAAAAAYRGWRTISEESAGTGQPLIESGEGRTRFLALWGIMIGLGFFIAVAFDFAGLWVLPICG